MITDQEIQHAITNRASRARPNVARATATAGQRIHQPQRRRWLVPLTAAAAVAVVAAVVFTAVSIINNRNDMHGASAPSQSTAQAGLTRQDLMGKWIVVRYEIDGQQYVPPPTEPQALEFKHDTFAVTDTCNRKTAISWSLTADRLILENLVLPQNGCASTNGGQEQPIPRFDDLTSSFGEASGGPNVTLSNENRTLVLSNNRGSITATRP